MPWRARIGVPGITGYKAGRYVQLQTVAEMTIAKEGRSACAKERLAILEKKRPRKCGGVEDLYVCCAPKNFVNTAHLYSVKLKR
mmetsp:Transcript_16685/g.29552  ORF Transcript_16685/g.29552 Transcript_16685/m.29552 type:complete len:84 (-) Transcript_16685:2327-2578(-)